MNVYLVAVAYHDDLTNSPRATAAIIFSEVGDHTTLLQNMLPLMTDVGLYDMQAAELQDDVLVALAKHAKDRGLI